jgi:hypothetical protein
MPLGLTTLGLIYYQPCGDGFSCFVAGRGFPLPYLGDFFYAPFFIADYVILVVVYALIVYFIKKLNKKNKIVRSR